MIKCGNCKGEHASVDVVRACYMIVPRGATVATLPRVPELPLITDKQTAFALDLATKRDLTGLIFGKKTLDEIIENERLRCAGESLKFPVARLAASQLIDELLDCKLLSVPAGATWKTAVPAGRYAVDINGKLRFFRVTYTKRGFLKIAERAGDAHRLKLFVEYKKIINAILRDGVDVAGPRYGREIGECYACGRALTDETSRARGIGPVCEGR